MTPTPFPEINRDVRGHDFYPSDAECKSIPALYETEDVRLSDKVVYAHYFVRNGVGEWHVFELERGDETHRLAFAMCDLGVSELGYVDLIALEGIIVDRPDGTTAIVERDLDWTPRPWSEVTQ